MADPNAVAELSAQFGDFGPLIAAELERLTEDQLDWSSDRWEWANWTIRNNVSHMASLMIRRPLMRMADALFPTVSPYWRSSSSSWNQSTTAVWTTTSFGTLACSGTSYRRGCNWPRTFLPGTPRRGCWASRQRWTSVGPLNGTPSSTRERCAKNPATHLCGASGLGP